MIEKDVEFVIKNLKSTDKSIYDSFVSRDIKSFNMKLITSTFSDYTEMILSILDGIENGIENKNHDESKTNIIIFLDVFHVFKKFDFDFSKEALKRFVNLCTIYEKQFLDTESNLYDWYDSIIAYLNNEINPNQLSSEKFLDTEKNYLDIFDCNLFNRINIYEDFNIQSILSKIVRDSYSFIRSGGDWHSVYNSINVLISYFISDEYDSSFYYRVLSLIVLKYDIMFQFSEYDKKDVDDFMNDLNYIYRNNLYDGNREAGFKILEGYGKAAFAARLIDYRPDVDIYVIYKKIIANLYIHPRYSDTENKQEFITQLCASSRILNLFEEKSFERFFSNLLSVYYWKQHRQRYYGNSNLTKLQLFLFNQYKFI